MIPTHFRKVFRANLDDVENLSYGRGAKKQRGTGSRFTCHRLNRDERRIFDQAKRDGYVTVRGTGYRKNRKGSPVVNTFRQRCDALAQICVIVEKRSESDRVVIDFSTLRLQNDSSLVSFLMEAVFLEEYPDFYNALISKTQNSINGLKNDLTHQYNENDTTHSTTIQVENTTHRPIHWETVKSKPIWGVDERLLVVTCDRETAKSIAMDVLKAINTPHFVGLQVNAESIQESKSVEQEIIIEKTRTEEESPAKQSLSSFSSAPTVINDVSHNSMASDSNTIADIDCIDWNDI